MTGNNKVDYRKFKQRIQAIDPRHAAISPYAHHVRLVLYDPPRSDVLGKFIIMCKTAGLSGSILTHCQGNNNIESTNRLKFFEDKKITRLTKTLKSLAWPIAFQLEFLLRSGFLHTGDLDALLPYVQIVKKEHGPDYTGELLRNYYETLQSQPGNAVDPLKGFHRVQGSFVYKAPHTPAGNFRCYHVTVTPTRLILEGPYPVQSNRVIRQYRGYEDNFLRVDFKDEDRLQYRWDKEVDGSNYLKDRIGGTLREGFELGGRPFQFLAYSMSALREHSVYFVTPFTHPKLGSVDAYTIRDSLGVFEPGSELMRWPSKYAARLSQAFTATDPSVSIRRDEWERADDLGKEPYLFTDGVGTISKALSDRIWSKLCEGRRGDHSNIVQPSAYQIRFLGFKGVVSVDEQLDKNHSRIHMRLRQSMEKFQVTEQEESEIEIAQAYERPSTFYLNKPLITVLEGLGIGIEIFEELQQQSVAKALTIDDSTERFYEELETHSLGRAYRLPWILRRLEDLGLELKPSSVQEPGFDTPFIRQVRRTAMLSILRGIQHDARIFVPESHLLVGVADEGPAYEKEGMENVYCLEADHIYVCIQASADDPPIWLKGACSISRSPVAHPGDVQRVWAIGPPPEGKICSFRNLKNCVVLPSQGNRSLASCLGGGDVDGDMFAVVYHENLLHPLKVSPASYKPEKPEPLHRDCTVEDICDFVVEYINSDVLGLLSKRLLLIADQSEEAIHDKRCKYLAELCSRAVDYPKQGIPVNIEDDKLPKPLIRGYRPDWDLAEVNSALPSDYYESQRALGVLHREMKERLLETTGIECLDLPGSHPPLADTISKRLLTQYSQYLGALTPSMDGTPEIKALFNHYVEDLRYISLTHIVTNAPGAHLEEAEIVAGTILANPSQKQLRKDRMYRMRIHTSSIVKDTKHSLVKNLEEATREELLDALDRAWAAWAYSHTLGNRLGANSFGLIALGLILECLDHLGASSDSVPDDLDEMDEY